MAAFRYSVERCHIGYDTTETSPSSSRGWSWLKSKHHSLQWRSPIIVRVLLRFEFHGALYSTSWRLWTRGEKWAWSITRGAPSQLIMMLPLGSRLSKNVNSNKWGISSHSLGICYATWHSLYALGACTNLKNGSVYVEEIDIQVRPPSRVYFQVAPPPAIVATTLSSILWMTISTDSLTNPSLQILRLKVVCPPEKKATQRPVSGFT